VDDDRGDAGAVPDRGVHALRRGGAGAVPAHALAFDELMFGHLDLHRWQVEALAPLDSGYRPARPGPTATATRARLVRLFVVGRSTCRSVVPSWPGCPPGSRRVFARNDRDIYWERRAYNVGDNYNQGVRPRGWLW
jgi:hypothetical protein